MKIVFYNETLMSGGIEKCIETLIEYLYLEHSIEIVYIDEKKLDPKIVSVLEKRAYVHKLNPTDTITADVCIWCRLYMDYNTLKKQIVATKNFLWVHSKPREKENCILDNKEFLNDIDKIICVSDTVQKQLLVNTSSMVIHNFLPYNIKELAEEKVDDDIFANSGKLKLLTVSRLSNGKGFERVIKLVNMLKENKIDFEYVVIGKGRAEEKRIRDMFQDIDEVKFIGYKENPYPYIKKADYLVQLSDFETWGNVITESKFLKTPIIVTNFESAYEQVIDEHDGIIIDLEEIDYNKYLTRIISNNSKYINNLNDFNYENEIRKWNRLLEDGSKNK